MAIEGIMGDIANGPRFWTEIDPQESAIADLTATLRQADGPADIFGAWPESLWTPIRDAGVARWSIPREQGGEACPRPLLIQRYARLAEASLTAAFILSQHDAATRRLAAAADRPAAREWLAAIVAGRAFATVGISQLTTSRRLGARALIATETGPGRYQLNGGMPWVTAAERADAFVTGALFDDGRQVLLVLPSDRPGVTVKPSFELAALQASRTAEVVVDGVTITDADILMGPAMDISSQPGAVGTAGLETSALALGQSAAAITAIAALAADRDELVEPLDLLLDHWRQAWSSLILCARGEGDADAASALRVQANALVLRSTQACLTARKGRGFLSADPAQRWARQALFFLVWSCPSAIAQAAIRELAGVCSE